MLLGSNYFLKVYVMQKKFYLLDVINQEKTTSKSQLTSWLAQQFNGMFIVSAKLYVQEERLHSDLYTC